MKKTNKMNGKMIIVILTFILIVQVGVRIFYGNEKAYLHMDEGYSYGLMNYKQVELLDNQDFYETWHPSEYYEDYLSISKEEAFNFKPVYENQKNDVHPPFYYALLRIAASFTIDSFSKWTGIVLNIGIFIISAVMIYLLSYRIFKSKTYAIMVTIINGFTIASIESTVLIRMYALNALNLILISYWHVKIREQEKLGAKELIPLTIFAVLGSLTHYYYLIFLAIIAILFVIRYLRLKEWKNLIRYSITMIVSGVISLAIFPYSFVHMFMGYRGEGAFASFGNIEQMWNSLGKYLGILNNSCFNGILFLIILAILFIVIVKIVKRRKLTIQIKNTAIWYLVIPVLTYFLLVAMVSPYQEIRYIMPICPLMVVLVFYLLKIVLEKVMSKKNTLLAMGTIFILMIIVPTIFRIPISYLYLGEATGIQKTIALHELPTLYILNKNQNRFLDDLYLFSKLDESYIMDSASCNVAKLKEILKGKDTSKGMIIIINEGIEHDTYLQEVLEATSLQQIEHIQRMNACNIYRVF